MDTQIEEPRLLVEELPDQIGLQVYAMFCAGWPIRTRMRATMGRTCLDVRACSPVGGVDDAHVRLVHDGRWGVDETSTGLVSPAGALSVRGSAAVLEHVYSHVPAWLVPELGSEPPTGVVDLHDRLADIDDDPVLDELAGRYESVFATMDCALGTGWDLVMDVASHGGRARIEMSTRIPSDLSGGFLQYVGEVLDIDIRDMRMHWMFRDDRWQLDTAQTGFVSSDGTVDTVGLDTLREVMEIAAANCAWVLADISKQWHSGGAATPPSALPAVPLAPEPPPNPEVIAARAHRIAVWAAENGFCAPLEPTPVAVIRHLDQAGVGRVGYYILEFTDGQCYIGESIDLPERLKQHRGRYQDIHRVRVRPDTEATRSQQGKRHLRLREKSLIHGAQHAGLLARNINEMATMIGASKHLDQLISPEEQRSWLDAPDVANTNDTTTRPSFPAERLARTAANYRHFRTRSDADQITRIVGDYLTRCVPYPARTEHHCWVISCLTAPGKRSGRMSCLSIAMTETLVIYQDRGTPAAGKIQVNEAELFPTPLAVREFFRRHPTTGWSDVEYQESGPGQLFLYADTLDALERLLDDVAVTRAAATTALHIMRKGTSMHRKVHCPQLAGAAFDAGHEVNGPA
ncbi:GIY-YIG nuclease family protein [Rhodococcus aetherivorans]